MIARRKLKMRKVGLVREVKVRGSRLSKKGPSVKKPKATKDEAGSVGG